VKIDLYRVTNATCASCRIGFKSNMLKLHIAIDRETDGVLYYLCPTCFHKFRSFLSVVDREILCERSSTDITVSG